MSRRPLVDLISGNRRGRSNGSLPPSIDEKALERLEHRSAEMEVPTPKRVEDLPVRTATQAQQDTSNDVKTETKSGVASSDAEAGWYKVTFAEPFAEGTRPSVTASCEERQGEFKKAEFNSPEHGSPEEGPPGVADVSLGSVDIAGVDLGTYSVGDFSISSSSVSPKSVSDREVGERSVSERTVEKRGISERTIDSEGVASFDNVFKNFSLSQFQAGDVELEFGEDDVELPSVVGFEDELKAQCRNLGGGLYDNQEEVIETFVPGVVPGSGGIEDALKDFYDLANKVVFGKGRTTFDNGEGGVESLMGAVGRALDETVRQWIVNKAQEELKLARRSQKAIQDQKGEIESEISGVEEEIVSEINNKLVDQINDRMEKLRSNSSDAVNYLGRNADTEFTNLIQEINEVREEFASDIDTEISGLSSDVSTEMSGLSGEVNDQFTGLTEDINTQFDDMSADITESFEASADETNAVLSELTAEINSAVTDQNEDINANLTELRDSVEDNILQVRDDTEVNMIDLKESIESALEQVVEDSVNKGLSDYNSNVQKSYSDLGGMSQEALNQSPKLFYDSIGAPEGELITPVQVRNIDNEGFEFLGYEGGMTIDWMAMGVTQESDDSEQTEPEEPPDSGGDNGGDNGDNGDGGGNGGDGTEDPTPRPPVDTPILDKVKERLEGS